MIWKIEQFVKNLYLTRKLIDEFPIRLSLNREANRRITGERGNFERCITLANRRTRSLTMGFLGILLRNFLENERILAKGIRDFHRVIHFSGNFDPTTTTGGTAES